MKKALILAVLVFLVLPPHAEARRLFMTGFEWQSVTSGIEWDTTTNSPTINTTTKHSGAASMRANTSATTAFIHRQFRTDAVADAYQRTYIYIASAPGADTSFLQYCDSANFCGAKVKLTSGRQLKCTNSDGSLSTSGTATLNTSQWYLIDMLYNETANTCTVKVDGTTDINAGTVDDIGGGGRIRLGVIDSATTDLYFDDAGVNDTATTLPGAVTGQTSYLGAGNIAILVPNAAGDSNCTTGDYSMISEIPPSNTATSGSTMCELDTDGGMNADFNMTDSSTAGIDSYDTITLIYSLSRSRDDSGGAGANTYKHGFKSASGGTTRESGTQDPSNATVRTNPSGTKALALVFATTTDPTTNTTWTPTGTNSIDNMQFRFGTTDGAPDVWLLTAAVLVEYVDGSPPASGVVKTPDLNLGFPFQ